MKAVIMAGGEGTRLRPLTCDKPKPMVTLFDKPVMEHIIDLLKRNGLTQIAVTLRYMPDEIVNYFGDGRDFGVKLSYFIEKTPLGTAGSVRGAEDFLNEDFLVISGDCVCDMDLLAGIEFHNKNHALATLILSRVEEPLQYGVVMCGQDGKIKRFIEKPAWPQVFCDTVNTGVYVLSKDILKEIPKDTFIDFSKDVFPRLLQEGRPLFGFVSDGYWCDIGDCAAYHRCHMDLLAQQNKDLYAAKDVLIEQGAVFRGRCAIEEGAWIGRGAVLENSVIKKGARVKEGAYVSGAVIGDNATVFQNAVCSEGSVLGAGAQAGPSSLIGANVKIWPNVEAQGKVTQNIVSAGSGLYPCYGAFCEKQGENAALFFNLGSAVCSFMKGKICVGGLSSTTSYRRSLIGGCEGTQVYDTGTVCRGAFVSFLLEKGCAGGVFFAKDDDEVRAFVYNNRGLLINEAQSKKIAGLLSFGEQKSQKEAPVYRCEGVESAYIQTLSEQLGLKKFSGERVAFFGDGGHSAAQVARLLKISGIVTVTKPKEEGLPAVYIEKEVLSLKDKKGNVIEGVNLFLILSLFYQERFPDRILYMKTSDPQHAERVLGKEKTMRCDSNYSGVKENDLHSIYAREDILFSCGLALFGLFEKEDLLSLIDPVYESSREVYCPPAKKGGVISGLLREEGADTGISEGVRISMGENGSIYIVAHPHRHVCTVTADAFKEEVSRELCDFYEGKVRAFVEGKEEKS